MLKATTKLRKIPYTKLEVTEAQITHTKLGHVAWMDAAQGPFYQFATAASNSCIQKGNSCHESYCTNTGEE